MSKPIELQYTYKKLLSFTNQQKQAFETLEKYNVNVNNFVRIAVREKLQREWKSIKESKPKDDCPF